MQWLKKLRPNEELSLIWLLGKKPDGTDEHSFYSFKTANGFQKWLQEHSPRKVHFFHYPTMDYAPVSDKQCAEISARLNEQLLLGRTVVIVDSGGVQRTAQVCRRINLLEDTRSID